MYQWRDKDKPFFHFLMISFQLAVFASWFYSEFSLYEDAVNHSTALTSFVETSISITLDATSTFNFISLYTYEYINFNDLV